VKKPKSPAQLEREIAKALTAKLTAKRPWPWAKRPVDDVIEAMNRALRRFPSILKAGGWDFGGELLAGAEAILKEGTIAGHFDPDMLEMTAYPGTVIDLYETRRARRVILR
jgi:hypothetical protein